MAGETAVLSAHVGQEDERTEPVTRADGTVLLRYAPDSCYWPSVLAAFPQYPEWADLEVQVMEVNGRAQLRVSESEEFGDLLDAWNGCVAAAGGTYASREEVISRTFGPTLSQEEIDAAVIDARCKHESGLLRGWSALRAEAESEVLADHPSLVTEYVDLLSGRDPS